MTIKRFICAALLLAAFDVMSGCAKQTPQPEPQDETSYTPSEAAEQKTEEESAAILVSTDAEAADDAERSLPPRLVVVPKKAADNVSCEALLLAEGTQYPDLQASLDEMNAAVERLSAENAAMFEAMEDEELQGYDRRRVEIKRADGDILSVLLLSENYNGGDHAYSHAACRTFVTADGSELTIGDVITSIDALPALLTEKLTAAYPGAYLTDTKALFEGYTEDGGSGYVWTLSGDGITFWFEPGLIASYADGLLSATVRYAEQPSLFEPRYCRVPASFVTEIGENEREGSSCGDISIRFLPSDRIDGFDSLAVGVDGNVLLDELTTSGGTLRAYILHDAGSVRLLAETRADAYNASLRLYDLTNGTPKLLQSLPGVGLAYHITPEGFGREVPDDVYSFDASEPLYLLGMTVGTRRFVLADDGLMRTYDTGFYVDAFEADGTERVLTVLAPFEALEFDMTTGEAGETVTLQIADTLRYVFAYSDGRLVMRRGDGSTVLLVTDAENGTVYADSVDGIPAETLFAGIMKEEETDKDEVRQDA